MRILLLEDEESIRGFIRINLRRNGMEVTEAEEGETALALAREASPPFDIALLDVMLPTISGFEVCEKLRELFPRMGIIMLTAKSQEEDKIRGLELGADDYVQKPFSPGELIARLNALHRRMMPGGLSEAEGAGGLQPSVQDGSPAEGAAPASGAGAPAGGAGASASGASAPAGEAGAPAGGAGASASGAGASAGGAGASAGEAGASASGAGASAGQRPAAQSGGAGTAAHAASDAGPSTASAPAGQISPPSRQADGGGAGRSADTAGGQLAAAAELRQAAPDGADGGGAYSPAAGQADGLAAQTAAFGPDELRSGPFRLSARQRRLWKEQQEIVLTPTEWTLVRLLMERAGEGLSRDDILDAVWGRHFIGDLKIVDVNIRRIRQKLEDAPSEPKYIETLWGFGYRWKRSGGP